MPLTPVGVTASPLVVSTSPPGCVRIAVFKTDRLYADGVVRLLTEAMPQAHMLGFGDVEALAVYLEASPVDLLVSGLSGQAVDLISRLTDWKKRRCAQRILLVTSRKEPFLLLAATRIPVEGILDAKSEGLNALTVAVKSVLNAGVYFSSTIKGLALGLKTEGRRPDRIFTPGEMRVLTVIGKGVDDRVAAGELGLSVHTVRKHRENIHRKLGVQTRNDLMGMASKLGAVAE